jgi:N-acetyl-anhydromuramyl-L-alanine amidase AmpD
MEIIETNLEFRSLEKRKLTRRVILHHAEASNCTAEDIHRWHLNRGWSGAGYHFLVRKDGTTYRLRPEDCVGAHAYGSNYDSIGICAEGKYNEEEMAEAQKQAIIELVRYLENKYNMNTIQKHKDVCATSCPGNNYPFTEIVNGIAVSGDVEEVLDITTGEIATIQNYVNEKYGFNIAVDNIYGNETKKALVKALQIELNLQYNKGLAVDGIFGAKSKAGAITVRQGAEGNITYLIQAMLICHSFNIDADGIFGQATENAIKEFQARNSLSADGICGRNTFYALFR